MKKKLVLIVAVVLIAITACACLAGCVPNRPDRYMGTWLTANIKLWLLLEWSLVLTAQNCKQK